MKQTGPRSPFEVEKWVVEPGFNQLKKDGATHRIEPKAMAVLVYLASQAHSVVPKDEILKAVWPDTFVGEDTLTRCISGLRRVLEDDPHHPRFIKTIFKVGYCLMADVRPLETSPGNPTSPEPDETARTGKESPSDPPLREAASAPPGVPGRRTWVAIGLGMFTLALSLDLAIWLLHSARFKSTTIPIRTIQLTTDPGEQSRPALSPDGKRVAFVWAKEGSSRQQIYVESVDEKSPVRLTSLSDNEYSPAWSPDGKQIAFLSSSDEGLGLYVVPLATPLSLRKVYIPGMVKRWEDGALSWSPDGRSFVLVDHIGAQASSSIYLIDVATLRARGLTTPPPGWEGDNNPVFSSDGTKVAFLRATEGWDDDLYWMPVSGGEPHQITHDGKMISGITWSPDSRSIIFSSNRAGQDALWKASLEGGEPQRMPVGTEDAFHPSISLTGNDLAFVQRSAIFGIMRISVSKDAARETRESLIVSSTGGDSAPTLSPDGTQFAFQSWRSGTRQIWVSSIDGHTLRQLTRLESTITAPGSPAWSPDGSQILFDARIYGHAHVFMAAAKGGDPRQLTYGDVNDIVPRWSADGHSLYFRSNRGGLWQLWKLPASGGTPQAATDDDAMVGQESPDGKWLYFTRGDENSGIWRMPVSGGEVVKILDQPKAGYWAYWEVTPHGIYFLDQRQAIPSVSIYDPATQKTGLFVKLNRQPPMYSGLCVLGDGRDVFISDKREAGSHISITHGTF
jgi:Tol biopolymer transport system component/DNA-binding winged helix-turn-helix (wHTH) protein